MLLRPEPGMAAWPAAMIVWGPGFTSSPHRHHCVQLVVALRGSLLVRSGPEEAWKKCGAFVVRPDAAHEVDARGTAILIGFIDAESEMGLALSKRIEGEWSAVPARAVAHWRAVLGPAPDRASAARWVASCLPHGQGPAAIHPGVRRVLTHLRDPHAMLDDLSLSSLARVARLSRSRFMHVFTQSVGIPVRPYILWIRLQRAASALAGGASLTTAAHRAGFADAAHMTRTFRRMLGTTPSALALEKRQIRGLSVESVQEAAPRSSEELREHASVGHLSGT